MGETAATLTSSLDFSRLSPAEKQILIFSFYRDAELRGARLLFNLLGHMKGGEAQLKMTAHLADETRHAYLWTKRISELGGAPIMMDDGYQRRLGLRTGVPKTLIDLLALTQGARRRRASRQGARALPRDRSRSVRDARRRRSGADARLDGVGKDSIVPVREAHELDQLLTENNRPHEIKIYDGAGHAFDFEGLPFWYRADYAHDAWERGLKFLAENLHPTVAK